MKNVTMICDLQFGSTGKGLIAGYLAKKICPDTVATAWMPNAGHTFIDSEGRKFVHTMLANGIVSPSLKKVLIGPGSMINSKKLAEEIISCSDLLKNVDIMIHPHAGVVTDDCVAEESKTMDAIGSTKKGCGEAIISKIRRNPKKQTIAIEALNGTPMGNYVVPIEKYNEAVDKSKHILVEGAQGFSLSINHGFYPYCTSRDVTPAQIMADTGIPYTKIWKIVGTMRVHPIRVANRYNEKGDMIGWSGPHYEDQIETSWDDLGVEPEKTTVTKLTRRIFTYSSKQIQEACRVCVPHEIFLNFVNYLPTSEKIYDFIDKVNGDCFPGNDNLGFIRYIGNGPSENDIWDLTHETIKNIWGLNDGRRY